MLGGVGPRLDLPLEADVGPRLVRVPGEQQALGDAEARVGRGAASSARRASDLERCSGGIRARCGSPTGPGTAAG